MNHTSEALHTLRLQIQGLEDELITLKRQLAKAEVVDLSEPSQPINPGAAVSIDAEISAEQPTPGKDEENDWRWPLDADEYRRYGRQMIMPEISLEGQLRLKETSVLVIGIGGLGCPAASYLAGAGVGTLGLLDGDVVETSNLHRQILHKSTTVGKPKASSAIENLRQLNPKVKYRAHPFHLEPGNALDVFDRYDVILDCTDHPTSRYLISDAAIITRKPLVSASALKTEGQLLVLNWPPSTPESSDGGFCYRCVFPKPPPPESVVDCGAGGILGPVVGVMGVLMAVETIKIIMRLRNPPEQISALSPSLLLYSAFNHPPFRSVRLRGKRPGCPSCSSTPTINRHSLLSGSLDYSAFCGVASDPNILSATDRVSATEYSKIYHEAGQEHILVDVREKPQFDICHLQHSINIPFSTLSTKLLETQSKTDDNFTPREEYQLRQKMENRPELPIYILCRFGNDSQLAVQKMRTWASQSSFLNPSGNSSGEGKEERSLRDIRDIRDIKGGLQAWRKEVDPKFPEY